MHDKKIRCGWVNDDPLYLDYHDHEWGVPVFDDQKLFEFLILEGMQAGLSWLTILKKRENFRKHFANFEPAKISSFHADKVNVLMNEPSIIRNRLKINAVIQNAKAYLQLIQEMQSLSAFLWGFVDGEPIQHHWKKVDQVPAEDETSKRMSKELKKRGFKFVGLTICYAFMQAVGMVNDHTTDCFRYQQLKDDCS